LTWQNNCGNIINLVLTIRQAEEMSEALSGGIGGRAFTDIQINNLAQRHFERLEVSMHHCKVNKN